MTDEEQQNCADPAEAIFGCVAAKDSGLSYVRGERSPAAVVVQHLTRRVIGLEIAVGPVVLVEAESANVTAHNAFAEDAAGKETEPLLSSATRWRWLILVIAVMCSSAMPRDNRSMRRSSPKLPIGTKTWKEPKAIYLYKDKPGFQAAVKDVNRHWCLFSAR